ncbi:Ubiquitin-like protein 4A-A [Portunus trituberculatus]|uniref:Ubiquitin-like protein 4A-A n=1 Tax=Portunus trituberculatus TaxID=210409 RepID=A0A5B7EJP9_PORTR|nr:Ubiquitin-like protein 4A-A [Portunus trituberculatus]
MQFKVKSRGTGRAVRIGLEDLPGPRVFLAPQQHGTLARQDEVPETTKVSEVKTSVEHALNVPASSQRLVYKGKTLSDEMSLREVGVTDGGKIHLMVKKGEGVASTPPAPGSSKTPGSPPALDFFVQLDTFLGKHLTQEQTNKVVNEFRKGHMVWVGGWTGGQGGL